MRTTVGLIVVFAIVSFPIGVLAADNEAEARKIEVLLMAPCCGANTLAIHDSDPASKMKLEIREMLASGMSRQEILDHYVAKYGNTILSMPSTRGFGLVAYVLPFFALILGPFLIWGVLRRRVTEAPPDPAPLPHVDLKYRERIEKELRSYL